VIKIDGSLPYTNIVTKSLFFVFFKLFIQLYKRNYVMGIDRHNSRAVLVNGAIRTSDVHSAVRPMNIDLLWAIEFYCIPRTMRSVSLSCIAADMSDVEMDLM
jgi:hypothetical protein